MDWSYDLLSERERTVLRRLSVFAGGWTFEAAEAICWGDDMEASDILDLLTQLVDKSLVVAETRDAEARYRLLETVRQYCRDRLQESGEADIMRTRHRDWYLALVEQAQPDLHRGIRKRTVVRAAGDRARQPAQPWNGARWRRMARKRACGSGGGLQWFWMRHDHWNEARERLEGALARSGEAPPSALPWALCGATQFAWRRGDYALARALGEKGVTLCRELGEEECRAWLLFHLGIAAMRQRDYERATPLFDEGLALCHELANDWVYGTFLVQVGIMARYQGNYERAAALHAQSLSLLREVGDPWTIGYALSRLGFVLVHQSDYGRAAASFMESLTLCRETDSRWISADCLEGLARIASAKGQCEHAARLFGAAEVLFETVGWNLSPPDQPYHDRCMASSVPDWRKQPLPRPGPKAGR